MKLTKTQQSAVSKLLPKDRSKLDPATLMAIATAIMTILKLLGVKLPDILDVLAKNGLPDPTKK